MKTRIKRGQEIIYLIDARGCGPETYINEVLVVQKDSLTIHEEDSVNGLAKILTHSTSEDDGTYWYNYTDKKGKSITKDISALIEDGDSYLRLKHFIEGE